MQLDTAFETVPDDEDLPGSIEHWDSEQIVSKEIGPERLVEAFVHPRTGTASRIMEDDVGEYSVQPTMGDFGPFDRVVQSDDPTTWVSGPSGVIALEVETLSEARALALAWIRGWWTASGHIGTDEGNIRKAEPAEQ